MIRIGKLCLAVLVMTAVVSGPVMAQNKSKKGGGNRPSGTAPTKGTVQMPGDNGKLKTTYQLGEKNNELHFTLESAAFAMSYAAPEDTYLAQENQRLLVLTYTVQNPLNTEAKLNLRSFKFTVVSPEDQNFDFNGYILNAATKKRLDQSLKPAQKVKVIAVIPIHAVGPVNKLIVQRGQNTPVLRYDLTDKVEKLVSVFSKDGVDANPNGGTVTVGQPFDMKGFMVSFDEVKITKDPVKGYAPSKDYSYIVVRLSFANKLMAPNPVGFQYFTPELKDAGGQVHSWNRDILGVFTDDTFSAQVDPDATVTARYYFQVPDKVLVAPLKLKFLEASCNRFVTLEVKP
ncbi:MAG: hypothetical protein JST40_12890 [Armatimonadetes bacterium]|nr:hypothetical protein [Armatimonadota bacterium]